MKSRAAVLLLLFVFLLSPEANAGSRSAAEPVNFKPQEVYAFAKKVEKELAQRGAHIALVGRVGRAREDLPKGISFTHVGIFEYSMITTNDGNKVPGYAVYNLYQLSDHPELSELVQDFPADFFSGVYTLEAGVIIPTPKLQQRISEVIHSPTYEKVHQPHYSVIANPFTKEYQNCTEHTLDVVVAAIYQTDDYDQIKADIKAYFKPQDVRYGKLSKNGLRFASIFIPDVTVSDHPNGPVQTTTFTKIGEFLEQYKLQQEKFIVKPDTTSTSVQ
ncbi:DUF2145 domain-containing protein [Pseudodesulfovibrio sp.]|uniref:DUF2145 domain-containing protein n=1 Tax=unclassified Pseudodesulfovibrio TaxID=2661612 RepID=UPI003AFF9B03